MDDNASPVAYGVSHLDGLTPVRIKFNASGHMLMDSMTAIAFDPSIVKRRNDNDVPILSAVDDNGNIMPVVVHATTGAILVEN